jgi:hypothetical protein
VHRNKAPINREASRDWRAAKNDINQVLGGFKKSETDIRVMR